LVPVDTNEPEPTETELAAVRRVELGTEWLHRAHGALVTFHHGIGHAMSRPVAGDWRTGFGRRNSTRFHVGAHEIAGDRMAPTDDTSDRGQILVIVGLLVAVMLVALALVLNSAIFAENFSTRETADSEEPSAYAVDTQSTIADVYDRTNDNDTRKADYAESTFDGALRTWVDQKSDTAAENGALFEADWTTHVGWRLEQTENRSFTPADDDGATEWALSDGTNVRNVSAFEMDVNRTKLYNGADPASFYVFLSDGTDTWKVFVYRNGGGDIVVSADDPTTTPQCTRTTDRAVIDIRNGTVAGTDCAALNVPTSLDGKLSVEFRNVQDGSGDEQINGTYTLVVNGSDAVATDTDGQPEKFNVSGEASPTATAVVYAVRYDTRYQREETTHDREGWHRPRAEAH